MCILSHGPFPPKFFLFNNLLHGAHRQTVVVTSLHRNRQHGKGKKREEEEKGNKREYNENEH